MNESKDSKLYLIASNGDTVGQITHGEAKKFGVNDSFASANRQTSSIREKNSDESLLVTPEQPKVRTPLDQKIEMPQANVMNQITREELDAKLAQLKSEQNAMFSELKSSNQAMISKLDATVAQVTGIQTGLTGQMQGLAGQIQGLTGQVDGLRSSFTSLQTNIGLMLAFLALVLGGLQLYDSINEENNIAIPSPTASAPNITINIPSLAEQVTKNKEPAAPAAPPPNTPK